IYLNNKARQLPSVFFNIIFKSMSDMTDMDVTTYDDYIARVEGGRLIELFPPSPSIERLMQGLTEHNDVIIQLAKDYMVAFEADIINMLIGPLAEAKHIAEIDNEPFNHKLVNLEALRNYGGHSDLIVVNEYLHSFSADTQQKDEQLAKLFSDAFDFVNNDANWAAITKLANYILDGTKSIIGCEEIVLILDQSLAHFQDRRSKAR
ncbi:MAG: hypothetical protein ACXV8S_11995, partial [Methylobacter sp.]